MSHACNKANELATALQPLISSTMELMEQNLRPNFCTQYFLCIQLYSY